MAVIYAGYLLVALGTLALLMLAGRVTIQPRPLGKMNTFLQLALVMLTMAGPELAERNAAWVVPSLRALWWVIPAVAVATCADYVVQGVHQLRAARRNAAVS